MEDRQTQFEAQLTFLEKTVSELSEVVYKQQQELDHLTKRVERQQERLSSLRPEEADVPDIPPPHY